MSTTAKPQAASDKALTLSVLKALDILDVLRDEREGLSPSVIGQRLDISRPTVYRLLSTLAAREWVVRDGRDSNRYRLGSKVLQYAGAYLQHIDVRDVARPHMQTVTRTLDKTVNLFLRDDTQVVFVHQERSSNPIQSSMPIGSRGSMHSKAVGKAILAALSAPEVNRIVAVEKLPAHTEQTITDYARLQQELAQIRERGYAIAREEDVEGLSAAGAAIFDLHGLPIAGLAITSVSSYVNEEELSRYGELLRETASIISRELGYAPPS